jgi:hypothetical protein
MMAQQSEKLQPNYVLRRARLLRRSEEIPDSPMTRRQLAEAVNAWIDKNLNVKEYLSANDIGKLERGVVRWPRENVRRALRAVLAVASDAELGLYNVRESRISADDLIALALGEPQTRASSGVSRPEGASTPEK